MRALALVVVLIGTFAAGQAWGANPFSDIAGNTHAENIDAIYNAGITAGCAQGPTFYCPTDFVRRDQMASFLARIGGLSSGTRRNFPKANARSQQQAYCAVAAANPRAFDAGPCSVSDALVWDAPIKNPSITVGGDGLPIISFWSEPDNKLAVIHCGDPACTGPVTVELLKPSTGRYSSIAVSDHGNVHVSAYDQEFTALRYWLCTDNACEGSVQTDMPDDVGNVGQDTAIAVGTDGAAIVSYYDETNSALKVVHCPNCSTPTVTTIDADGVTGWYTSIAIGVDGFPVISYTHQSLGDLRVVHCNDVKCANPANITTIDFDDDVGYYSSIAIGIDGFPIISYYDLTNEDLKIAHCANVACTGTPTISTLYGEPDDGGTDTSIAIGLDGLPVISFTNDFQDVYIAKCSTVACSGAVSLQFVGKMLQPGDRTSIAIGIDGIPVVAYAGDGGFLHVSRPRPS